MPCQRLILAFSCLLFLAAPAIAQEPASDAPTGNSKPGGAAMPTTSGLPIPRFVSLRTGEINLRTGPGVRYPVEWVYKREGLPVEITAEYDTWRRIRDMEGAEGWVHQSMLSGKRTLVVTGADQQSIYKTAASNAPMVAKAEPQATGELVGCENAWCEVKFSGVDGYMPKGTFYGAYADEVMK